MKRLLRSFVVSAIETLRKVRVATRRAGHSAGIHWLGEGKDALYREYLRVQLTRTLTIDNGQMPPRAKRLIDSVTGYLHGGDCRILCIGCRNTTELDYFRSKGFSKVIGIDLYSPHPDIQIMDMHAMTFDPGSFELVYASHSLEHALDPVRVISEILRVAKPGALVAIEVPLNYPLTEADRVDYGSIEDLVKRFDPSVDSILWSETRPAGAADGSGTEIGRVVFRLSTPGTPGSAQVSADRHTSVDEA